MVPRAAASLMLSLAVVAACGSQVTVDGSSSASTSQTSSQGSGGTGASSAQGGAGQGGTITVATGVGGAPGCKPTSTLIGIMCMCGQCSEGAQDCVTLTLDDQGVVTAVAEGPDGTAPTVVACVEGELLGECLVSFDPGDHLVCGVGV